MLEHNGFQASPSPLDSSGSPVAPHSPEDNTSHGGQSSDTPLTKVQSAPVGGSNFPAPKTDKPRPHVCGTCGRTFARLEHLKRHERSHTKEKPFECPECTRCFARRDLLLRHQQKLHLTTAPSSRSSKARRESTASNGVNPSAKIRKSSTNGSSASANSGNMRPRANTISHVDETTLNFLTSGNRSIGSNGDFDMSMDHSPDSVRDLGIQAANGHHTNQTHLPRINTQGLHFDSETSLRTAPDIPGMNPTFAFDQPNAAGSTVNPAQLHLETSMDSANSAFSRFNNGVIEEEEGLDWLRGFAAQMNFNGANDHVIGASSPSVMSHGSNGALGEFVSDPPGGQNNQNGMMWQGQSSGGGQLSIDSNVSMTQDLNFHIGQMAASGTNGNLAMDNFYASNPSINSVGQHRAMNGGQIPMANQMTFISDGNSISSSSVNDGSARHSSITSISTESITETTRQALIHSLSQPSAFGRGNRKYSQPAVSSPLSPRDQIKSSGTGPTLPCTADLQRYVNAYIQYFHPHFPFLHIPTLSFDTPACNNNLRPASSSGSTFSQGGMVGGGGCLVLAMAAIGALYELDRPVSRELFDAAKKMIQLYLEERRNSDRTPSSKPGYDDQAAQSTPLWLVQAMLLNVIYGHNCGDKISGDIASTHCSALVSLARAAGLHLPLSEESISTQTFANGHGMPIAQDVQMGNDNTFQDPWGTNTPSDTDHSKWVRWVIVEERKRTLFAIFHMSSLLVSAYNHAPALMNSEVHLDLPCDEDLWCAESAGAWAAKGGAEGAQRRALPFASALATLLTSSHGHQEQRALSHEQPFGSGIPLADLPPSSMRPSTFGCLVLINALHNYIWETRQRHSGRQWTTEETESMHAHIEPALRAWQAAWASNPTHSLERPNPFGLGPLSADSIPLLDLAYVRLFVNLGMSKEAFWQRDFNAMSEELARGSEFVQHADHSESSTEMNNTTNNSRNSPAPKGLVELDLGKMDHQEELTVPPSQAIEVQSRSSKRERHLRKAAFYAADSLSMSDKLGVTFADFTSRELPVQSALCTFDCAQVLAEWVATVQERVGRYLGILGRDHIEYGQVPAIMLLEDEDCKLLEKISDILSKAEAKMTYEINSIPAAAAMTALQRLPSVSQNGYGSKILLVTAHMLERAAVWPVTNTMAQGLEIQAQHMQLRAENSVLPQTG